jgi:hypothetical protein
MGVDRTAVAPRGKDGPKPGHDYRDIVDAMMAVPSLAHMWADGGYAGKLVGFAHTPCRIVVEIVKVGATGLGLSFLFFHAYARRAAPYSRPRPLTPPTSPTS